MKRMYRCWKNRGGKICQIFICGFPAASEMPQISSIILSISRGEVGNIRKRFWKDMKVISIQMLIPDTMQFRSKTLSSLHASASDFRGCTSQRYPYPGNIKTCGSNPPSESTLWHRVRIEGAFSWPEEKERLIRAKTLLKAFWSWAEKNAMGELRNPNFRTFFIARWRTVRDFFHYLEDGNGSISNSLAENGIRPFVIGRKNCLFSGSLKRAGASARIYTPFYLTLTFKVRKNGTLFLRAVSQIPRSLP